jgi:hypothetical protein
VGQPHAAFVEGFAGSHVAALIPRQTPRSNGL